MSHFAKVVNGKVINVIVAEQDFIDILPDKNLWIQTSYNTWGGKHYKPDSNPAELSDDQSKALRYNYAQVGGSYDATADAFYDMSPYNSWTLDKTTYEWKPPVAKPSDGKRYEWDEDKLKWVEITPKEATPVEETQSAAKVPPTPVTPSSVAYKDCTSEIE